MRIRPRLGLACLAAAVPILVAACSSTNLPVPHSAATATPTLQPSSPSSSATAVPINSASPGTSASPAATATPSASATAAASATPAASAGPAASPVPSQSPVALAGAFVAAGTAGVNVYSPSTGAFVGNFASSFGAGELAMDDGGDAFVVAPSGQSIAKFAIGGANPTATYVPTPETASANGTRVPYLIVASRDGTLAAEGASFTGTAQFSATIDIWDPGVTGAPSRTISYPAGEGGYFGDLAFGPNDSLYVVYGTGSGTAFDVYQAGSTKPSQTFPEQDNAEPNNIAVGPDGTFYTVSADYDDVTDPTNGLYVHKLDGTETFVTNGAPAPTALDVDDAGDLDVVNSNSVFDNNGQLTDDTLHTLTVYSPFAASITRQVTSGFSDGQAVSVSPDGSETFIIGYPTETTPAALYETIAPSTSATTIADAAVGSVVFYDGKRAKSVRTRAGSHGLSRGGFGAMRHRPKT